MLGRTPATILLTSFWRTCGRLFPQALAAVPFSSRRPLHAAAAICALFRRGEGLPPTKPDERGKKRQPDEEDGYLRVMVHFRGRAKWMRPAFSMSPPPAAPPVEPLPSPNAGRLDGGAGPARRG